MIELPPTYSAVLVLFKGRRLVIDHVILPNMTTQHLRVAIEALRQALLLVEISDHRSGAFSLDVEFSEPLEEPSDD